MKAIAAMSANRCIGKNGGLPWPSIKEDFKWFKEFTTGKKLLMGKNTFDTLPLLKNRECYVIVKGDPEIDSYVKNQYIVNNSGLTAKVVRMNDVYMMELNQEPDMIIAGGAKTYTKLLPCIDEFYVTLISGSYDGDAYMPPFEHLYKNSEVIREFDGHKVVKYTR